MKKLIRTKAIKFLTFDLFPRGKFFAGVENQPKPGQGSDEEDKGLSRNTSRWIHGIEKTLNASLTKTTELTSFSGQNYFSMVEESNASALLAKEPIFGFVKLWTWCRVEVYLRSDPAHQAKKRRSPGRTALSHACRTHRLTDLTKISRFSQRLWFTAHFQSNAISMCNFLITGLPCLSERQAFGIIGFR